MESENKYIPGHTGKIIFKTESEARYIAKKNSFGIQMRAYSCNAEGFQHWHLTRMSKGRYVTSVRKDKKKTANLPK